MSSSSICSECKADIAGKKKNPKSFPFRCLSFGLVEWTATVASKLRHSRWRQRLNLRLSFFSLHLASLVRDACYGGAPTKQRRPSARREQISFGGGDWSSSRRVFAFRFECKEEDPPFLPTFFYEISLLILNCATGELLNCAQTKSLCAT
nr:hypothetical protein Iba_chr03eCG3400 [Ipomoea batatas]